MKWLFIFQQAPYTNSNTEEAINIALTTSIFNQKIQVLFIDNGVYQILYNQQPKYKRNIEKMIKSLYLYNIEEIYSCKESIISREMNKSNKIELKVLSKIQINILIQNANKILTL